MSKRKITLKQFCQLFVKGTMIMVVGSRTEKFCAYTDILIDVPAGGSLGRSLLCVEPCFVGSTRMKG